MKKDKFKLKIVKSWFSDGYINFKYTTNGFTWKYIHCHQESWLGLLDYDPTWEKLSYRFNFYSNFDYEKEKFSTAEKIKAYEAQEWKEYLNDMKSIKEQRAAIENKNELALKKLNS